MPSSCKERRENLNTRITQTIIRQLFRERERDRQTDTQTDRPKEREREREKLAKSCLSRDFAPHSLACCWDLKPKVNMDMIWQEVCSNKTRNKPNRNENVMEPSPESVPACDSPVLRFS